MVFRTIENEIRWFRSAVKGALVLKAEVQEEEAERALELFRLDEKLNSEPALGLHYEPEEVAEEIISAGLVNRFR